MYLASFEGGSNQYTTFQQQGRLLKGEIKLLPSYCSFNAKQGSLKEGNFNCSSKHGCKYCAAEVFQGLKLN